MASYPTSIKAWTTKYDQGQAPAGSENEEINWAAHVNELQDEVAAVQTVLGTNPHGTAATVKARIAAVESGKSDTTHDHNPTYVRRDIVTTKGDVLFATGAGDLTRVGVGSAGQVLVPDSAQAGGVRWRQLGHEELGNLGGKAHPDLLDEAAHTALHPTGVGVKPFVGMITPSARADIPAEWLDCNGQAVSRTTYSALFDVIGTTYGAGDGSTTFNVPDLRGRFPVGQHPTDASFDALNETGGAKTVALTTAEMPSHTHSGSSGTAGAHTHTGSSGTQSSSHTHSGTTGSNAHSHTANSAGAHTHGRDFDWAFHKDGTGSSWTAYLPQHSGGDSVLNTQSNGAHTHTTDSPSHSHSFSTGNQSTSHTHSISSDGGHTHTVSVGSTGSGSSHENLPPYIVLKFVIFAGA